jgi:pimeloyl-ACP methyl ester carboxylesterase
MNGLQGRKLRMPGRKNREILIVYDAPTTLEHLFGLATSLASYVTVTIPDLPGFGGMQSFYRLHEKPTVDAQADYLAAFVKMQYKRRRITILGMSYGFVIATRMLQKYPELAAKVDTVISCFGYVHHEDFKLQPNRWWRGTMTRVASWAVPGSLIQLCLRRPLLRLLGQRKATQASGPESMQPDLKIERLRRNDFRTRMRSEYNKLQLDLCNKQVPLEVYHLCVAGDSLLDNQIIEQHLGVIYRKVTVVTSPIQSPIPKELTTTELAAPLLPTRLRRVLRAT